MVVKKRIYHRITFGLMAIFFLSGCASLSEYGKVRKQAESVEEVTTRDLVENFGDYRVYYNEIPGGYIRALLFDPIDDKKGFTTKSWTVVESREVLLEKLKWMDYNWKSRQVWKVLGPGDQFFGYLITTRWSALLTKRIDENTLRLYDLVNDSPPPRG
jgi:hypothetical protein